MSIFGIFGKKTPSSITAHILDPVTGYSKQTWIIGKNVTREVVDKLAEDGNIFVVVVYESGTPNQIICNRNLWNQTKAQFGAIEGAGQASARQLMDELGKAR